MVKEFIRELRAVLDGKLLVLCHDDADSDALGAAFAMASLLEADMGVPSRVSEHARELQIRLRMPVLIHPRPEDYRLTILVDTADAQQLPDCLPRDYLLIDHHRDNKLLTNARASLYKLVDSTCQLVWEVYQELGAKPTPAVALALAAGIMGDTRYLSSAANDTIIALGEILRAGEVTYKEILQTLRVTGRIDREVRLRAALSGTLHKVGDCMLVTTTAERNFVYYVTMMLLELGADIGAVGFQQGEECFIRLAKNPTAAQCLDIHQVLSAAVQDFSASNLWGSADFAGFNGTAQVEAVFARILACLEEQSHFREACQCGGPPLITI